MALTMTVRDMIVTGIRELGVVDASGEPSAPELQEGMLRYNAMVKSWGARGVTPWRNTDGTASMTGGSGSVALSPRPVDVLEARAVIGGEDVFLRRWGQGEYNLIRNKTTAGNPSLYSLIYTTDACTLKVWPVPASTTTIKYTYARPIAEADDPSDLADMPEMWLETAYMMLAVRMTTMFGATRIDPAMVENVTARAMALEQQMFGHDKPAAYSAVHKDA